MDTWMLGSAITYSFNIRLPNARDIARMPPTLHVSAEVLLSNEELQQPLDTYEAPSTIWVLEKQEKQV